jgi:hypothetical protein
MNDFGGSEHRVVAVVGAAQQVAGLVDSHIGIEVSA